MFGRIGSRKEDGTFLRLVIVRLEFHFSQKYPYTNANDKQLGNSHEVDYWGDVPVYLAVFKFNKKEKKVYVTIKKFYVTQKTQIIYFIDNSSKWSQIT